MEGSKFHDLWSLPISLVESWKIFTNIYCAINSNSKFSFKNGILVKYSIIKDKIDAVIFFPHQYYIAFQWVGTEAPKKENHATQLESTKVFTEIETFHNIL